MAVILEPGMKREAVDDLLERFAVGLLALELQGKVGGIDVLLVDKRPDLAPAPGHEQTISPRRLGQVERLLELRQFGKRRFGAVGRRRFRRTDDLRGRPRHALLQAERLALRLLAWRLRSNQVRRKERQNDQYRHKGNSQAHGAVPSRNDDSTEHGRDRY